MKFLTAITLVTFFLMGCGSPNLDDPVTLDKILAEAMDWDSLQKRGEEGEELYYAPNQESPFTGWAKKMYENGQTQVLSWCEDGVFNGHIIRWYENGQKSMEKKGKEGANISTGWYKNGQKKFTRKWKGEDLKMFEETWKPNGEKCHKTVLNEGNGVVLQYHENGQVIREDNYKDGKLHGLRTSWDENGKKILELNFKNGKPHGYTYYHSDGEPWIKSEYKDGEKVGHK